jgi:hypothetical protein
MSRARNLADLLDANGDVASGALDNVPASNDASALTTGTLPIARIADGDITAAKLGSTLDLSGKTVTLPSGTGGKVLQVVFMETATSTSTGSTSWINTDVTASITPSSSSSKILVITSGPGRGDYASGATRAAPALNLKRNGSIPSVITAPLAKMGDLNPNNNDAISGQFGFTFLDSPATTSSVTYTVVLADLNGRWSRYPDDLNGGGNATLTLMEIAG